MAGAIDRSRSSRQRSAATSSSCSGSTVRHWRCSWWAQAAIQVCALIGSMRILYAHPVFFCRCLQSSTGVDARATCSMRNPAARWASCSSRTSGPPRSGGRPVIATCMKSTRLSGRERLFKWPVVFPFGQKSCPRAQCPRRTNRAMIEGARSRAMGRVGRYDALRGRPAPRAIRRGSRCTHEL